MTVWLVGVLIAVALVVLLARVRRTRGADPAPNPPRPRSGATGATDGDPPGSPEAAAGPDAGAPEPGAAEAEAAQIRVQTLRALREIAFGTALPPGPVRIPDGDAVCAQVSDTLTRVVDLPNYTPRRPMQLPRLMQAINDETSSRGTLSQIIAGDPALTGNLLRLANSPYYRHGPEPIESLDRAVAMLGIEGLRSMIAAALLQPVFRVSAGSFARYGEITWEHSLFAANAAELHAAQVESVDAFAAQLLGLLLGLSHIVIFSVARDACLAHQRSPEAGLLAALIDLHAIGVARQIASSWELSERMDTALAGQARLRTGADGAEVSPLARSLHFGEFIGALGVLRQHGALDDAAALTALHYAGAPPKTCERVWARLGFMPD